MFAMRIVFTTLGVFLYLYFFWKKLKDDYIQNQIFTTAFYSLSGICLFSLSSAYYFPGYEFWFGVIGSFLGFLIGVLKYKLRFFEAFEAFVIANLGVDFLYNSFGLIEKFSIRSSVSTGTAFILIIAFFVIDKHYKKFTWYKSGKVGFTGLSVAGLYFVLRSVIDIIFPSVLSFAGRWQAVIFAALSFTVFILLYNLSQKKV